MRSKYLLAILIILPFVTKSQNPSDSILYNKEFKWKIKIPAGFNIVNKDSATAMQKRGINMLESTLNQKVEDNTTGIYLFKYNQFNYFESCSQPYDTLTDGNYSENFKLIGGAVVATFRNKYPDMEIDTSFSLEKISKYEFHKFTCRLNIANKAKFTIYMYSRLFGKRDLAINIYYLDEMRGYQMLNSWKKSEFE